jgi:hypothetical protein
MPTYGVGGAGVIDPTNYVGVVVNSTLAGVSKDSSGSFVPSLSGLGTANIFADWVNNNYAAAGATQSTLAAWIAALGGTYSRAGAATFIDSNGVLRTAAANVPRFMGSLGLRLTGPVTNLLLQSNNMLVSGVWATYSPAPVQNVMGPDNVANSGWTHSSGIGATNVMQNAISGAGTTAYTASCFIRQGTAPSPVFGLNDSTGSTWLCLVRYTWTAGVPVGTLITGAGTFAPPVQLVGGWWMLSHTGTPAATGHTLVALLYPETQVAANCTGLNTQTYGWQITNTSFQADYVPTAATNPAQAADALSFPYTQTTFSALLITTNQSVSTGAFRFLGTNSSPSVLSINSVGPVTIAQYNGTSQNSTSAAIGTLVSIKKMMSAGSPSGRGIIIDGVSVHPDVNAYFNAAPTSLVVGSQGGTANWSYGNNLSMAIWNGVVASNTDMQRLTTL